jgi:minor extracellular protease Epr
MKRSFAIPALILLVSVAAHAQLLPRLPGVPLPGLPTEALQRPLDRVERMAERTTARALESTRLQRVTAFLHDNAAIVAPDDRGFPAVRGEILLTAPAPDDLARLTDRGFSVIDDQTIAGLGLRTVRLATPDGVALRQALKRAREIAGDRVSADNIHFRSGEALAIVAAAPMAREDGTDTQPVPIGMIDGGVAATPLIPARVTQHGFASGAPAPDPHATAVASLLIGEGKVRGTDPGAHLFVADVYGRDPAGGGALAIAQALGWMVENGVGVVTVSLVGPKNALLARAVALAEDKGLTIVAAVGNDGPAAPPAYPASYPGVLAITGVDRHDKVLVEAGHALHLDYAAPGADMLAATPGSGTAPVRGTSFAAPLAAGRLAVLMATDGADARRALDREARDLGPKGRDDLYGRGLVCGDCATRP